jgi:hypothetical protein
MQKQINVYTKWLVIFPLIGLCGCAGRALRHNYADYSQMYADSINRQLLLNLARLSHNEPAYFIQLGTIQSQYKFNTSVGFLPSHTSVANPSGVAAGLVQDTLVMGGTLNAGVEESPNFQFVPLNGETFAKVIANPVPEDVFYKFYDQSYHADLLARIMVKAIEVETEKTPFQTNHEIYVNNPYDPSYPKFLNFCVNLRNAQLNHTLVVDKPKKNEPPVYKGKTPKLSEVVSAIGAGLNVKYDTNSNDYIVTKDEQGVTLVNRGETNDIRNLKDQTNAQTMAANALRFAEEYEARHYKPTMRTFEAIMYAVAKEEVYFRELLENPGWLKYNNINFNDDGYGIIATVTSDTGETNAFRPIIKIKYGDSELFHLSRLTDVKYNGVTYSIGDLENNESDPMYTKIPKDKFPAPSNRTVFTMISYLFTQISINPEKLPAQQLIQVQ